MFQFSQVAALAMTLLIAAGAQAQTHVVPLSDLQKDIVSASKKRQAQIGTVQKFLSSPAAAQALGRAGLDAKAIVRAVPGLNDEELARLAAQASQVQQDVAAGALSNQELTYAVIALGVAVIILLVVVA